MEEAAFAEDTAAFALLARICADVPANQLSPTTRAAAAELDDWDAFLPLVVRHRVAGIVHRLVSHDPTLLPPAVAEALAAKASFQVRRSLVLAGAMARLQALFDAEGIDAIFFKGALTGQRAFGSVAVKHGKDIDFLVPEEQLTRVLDLLDRHGFRRVFPGVPLTGRRFGAFRRLGMEVELVDEKTGVQVEPHWRLTENRRLLPLAPLVAAAGRHDCLAATQIHSFHPDDHLAYLFVHGLRSGWFRLKWLVEIHALVARLPLLEISRVHRHAAARGAGPAAVLALGLCREILGTAIPDDIVAAGDSRLQRDMRATCRRMLRDPHDQYSPWTLLRLSMLHATACGPGHILSELARWTINSADAVDVPLPRPLYCLYPLLRGPLWCWRRMGGAAERRNAAMLAPQ
ncbi:MAG: nucleotidyltransferase family protein [Pseudomonadota bacterium]